MEHPPHGSPSFEQDPYPKMIIVVIVIAIALFMLIAGVMAYDFVSRANKARTAPVRIMEESAPPAPGEPGVNGARIPVTP